MNKRRLNKRQLKAIAVIVFAVSAFGCSSAVNSLTKGDSWSSASNSNSAATVDLSTPAKSYAAYRQALKNKDLSLYKKVISKKIIDIKAENARIQNKSLDEFMRESGMPYVGDDGETRNETIDGDRATLDISSGADDWGKLDFVKESDGWKMNSRSRKDEKEAEKVKKTLKN